jgi:hypothetical protein
MHRTAFLTPLNVFFRVGGFYSLAWIRGDMWGKLLQRQRDRLLEPVEIQSPTF